MSKREKYVKYLDSIGFKKATKEEIEKYVSYEFEYIYDALWYIYDGDLSIEDLDMEDLPLIITGDLTMPNGAIYTQDHNGLVVLGKTNVKWLSINGNTHLKDVTFSLALLTSGNGAPRIVEKAQGPFLYHCSDSATFNDISKVQCYVNRDEPSTLENFCNAVVNPELYTEEVADWQLTKEQFDNNDKNVQSEYKTYEQYLVQDVGINDDEIERAILDGTFEIKKVIEVTTPPENLEDLAGAWSRGNFGRNDVIANNWLWELEDSNNLKTLLAPLKAILEEKKYLESDYCSEALAAAEVVAAGITGDLSGMPDQAKDWLNKKQGFVKKKPQIKKEHAVVAIQAVEKILNDSKLKELWGTTSEYATWQETQEKLILKLKKPKKY